MHIIYIFFCSGEKNNVLLYRGYSVKNINDVYKFSLYSSHLFKNTSCTDGVSRQGT